MTLDVLHRPEIAADEAVSPARPKPARLGIIDCDFENGQKRTIKDSGYWYRDLIKSGQIEYDETLE